MSEKIYNVLFLCTGNSARSILAESLLTHWGKGHFKGYSAGSHPKGEIHPMAIDLLTKLGMPTDHLRSKNWEVYAEPGAPEMDYVFTVCDQAAKESCPVWPGQPITAHWGLPDPTEAKGSEAERMLAFRDAFRMLERRIQLFVALHHKELSRRDVQQKVSEIGRERAEEVEGAAS